MLVQRLCLYNVSAEYDNNMTIRGSPCRVFNYQRIVQSVPAVELSL